MDFLIKHIQSIVSMHRPSIIVICVLCAIAAYFIRDHLANSVMIVFVYPVLVICSILVQYGFIVGEVFPFKKIDLWLTWTIMASICGTIIGIGIVAACGVLREGLRRPFKASASPRR